MPAGAAVLCWDDPATAHWLREARGDRVLEAGPGLDGLAAVAPAAVLAAVAPRGLAGVAPAERRQLLAALARSTRRYLVLVSWHPAAVLRPRTLPPPMAHAEVEALAAGVGFRPHARAARRLLLRPEWVYVFLRESDSATTRTIHQESRAAAPARPRT